MVNQPSCLKLILPGILTVYKSSVPMKIHMIADCLIRCVCEVPLALIYIYMLQYVRNIWCQIILVQEWLMNDEVAQYKNINR